MACEGYPTTQDAINFKTNADDIDEFVTSTEDTFTDRLGASHLTIAGIENRADEQYADINNQYVLRNKGDYTSDPLLEFYYEFTDNSGLIYFPIVAPYQVDSTTYPDPSNDPNLRLGQATDDSLVTATGSTTPRRLDDRFADVVNVKDFGAVGDGATDNTITIQAAIDATPDNGVLIIPEGDYKISADLLVTSPIRIIGRSNKSNVYWDQGVSIFGFNCTASDISIESLSIGTDYTRPSGKPVGVTLGAAVRIADGGYNNISLKQCNISGLNTGFMFVDGSNDIIIDDCTFSNLHHGTDSYVGGYGIVLQACQNTNITNCTFNNTINRRGIYLSTNNSPSQESLNHRVTNNMFYGRTGGSSDYSSGYEIHVKVRASSSVVISGNTFDGGLGGVYGEEATEHNIGNSPQHVSITGNTFKNFNVFNESTSVITCMNRPAKIKKWTIAGNTIENCASRFILLADTEDMVISGNTVEIVSGENPTYNTIECISGVKLENLNVTGNVFINKSTDAKTFNLYMVDAVGVAIENMKVSDNVMIQTGYSAADIRGYSGSIDDLSWTGNITKGYGAGAAVELSSNSTIDIMVSDNISRSSVSNLQVVSVTSSAGGSVRHGTVGGVINIPTSMIAYSDTKSNNRKEVVGTEIPTSGDWIQGDIMWRTNATTGLKIGWVCTVTGSPGTWRSWGDVT